MSLAANLVFYFLVHTLITIQAKPYMQTNNLSTDTPTAAFGPIARFSPEILNELKEFRNLIPAATVDEIVAKHLIVDGKFRKALKYLKSAQFKQQLQRVQQIPEIIEILDYLHLWEQTELHVVSVLVDAVAPLGTKWFVVNSEAAAVDTAQLEIVPLDAATYSAESLSNAVVDAYNVRTFTTVVEELMQHLPRENYVQMINAKRQRSTAFAEFYAALRSVQLRPLLDAAMKTSAVAAEIKILNSFNIDVESLLPLAFEVLSWGPDNSI